MSTKKPSAKKVKKPKVKKPSKTEQLEEAADLLKRIERAERDCQKAQQRMSDIKDEYKDAKGIYSTAVQELRTLCRARSEEHPLFDQKPETTTETATEDPRPGYPLMPTPEKDDWHGRPLEPLSLQTRYRKAFEEAGLDTLGKITDFINKEGDSWWRKVKGLGETGRAEYEERMITFWQDHPEYCSQKSEAG